jgi:hypothetical protein
MLSAGGPLLLYVGAGAWVAPNAVFHPIRRRLSESRLKFHIHLEEQEMNRVTTYQ